MGFKLEEAPVRPSTKRVICVNFEDPEFITKSKVERIPEGWYNSEKIY